jgi:hypothetical protein
VIATVKIPKVPPKFPNLSSPQRKYICGWDKHIKLRIASAGSSLDRLKCSWVSRECLLITHYELSEKGPIRVSCGKCRSGRSQVCRLALVYRLFLCFVKCLKFPFPSTSQGRKLWIFEGFCVNVWPKWSILNVLIHLVSLCSFINCWQLCSFYIIVRHVWQFLIFCKSGNSMANENLSPTIYYMSNVTKLICTIWVSYAMI